MFGVKRVSQLVRIFFVLSLFVGANSALAEAKVFTSGFFTSLAVSGYDPVAYFTQNKPVKGDSDFATKYNDATWRFSSKENMDLFVANPEKYAPQYGGYCAWALAHNTTAKSDPHAWTIVDGKLYLNYDASIQAKWLPRKSELIKKADINWPKVLN